MRRMMINAVKRTVALLCLLATVFVAPSEVRAETRVALVIGNAAYQNGPALKTVVNDAADVAD